MRKTTWIVSLAERIASRLTNAQGTLSWNRLAVIVVAVVGLYFVGYGLSVAGWRMAEANGGNAGPFPDFLPPQNFILTIFIIALSAVAAFLIVRRNAATR